MKLNFGKRLVLFLHWLLSLLICVLVVMQHVWPQLVEAGFAFFHTLIGPFATDIACIALVAVYAIVAVAAFAMLFSRKGKRADRAFITVDSSESGKTRIAVGAVDQMIRQAVRGVEGITEMKSSIVNSGDNISVNCSVAVASGVHVPTVTMNMQRAIRSYIELNCGVAVREVSVSVHSLESAEGGRGRKKGASAVAAPAAAAPVIAPEPVKEDIKPAPVDDPMGPPDEPIALEDEAEGACEAAEIAVEQEEETAVLPEIEPIVLTLDPPAAEENGEEASVEE